MSEALFALAGAIIGVLGAVLASLVQSRREDRRLRRESLRITCADFTSAIARMKYLATEMHLRGIDEELETRMRSAHEETRVGFERLRLLTTSMEAQEAARYSLRHAVGLWLLVQGKGPRPDEKERGPLVELDDRLRDLYAAVRRELGVAHPERVFREPDHLRRLPTAVPNPADTEMTGNPVAETT